MLSSQSINPSLLLISSVLHQFSLIFEFLPIALFNSATLFPLVFVRKELSSMNRPFLVQSSLNSQSRTCLPLMLQQSIRLSPIPEALILCVKSQRNVKEPTETFQKLLGDLVKIVPALNTLKTTRGSLEMAIVTTTDLYQTVMNCAHPELYHFCVEDLLNRTIDVNILHCVLKQINGK